LAKLRAGRLVTRRRDAQTVYYTCRSHEVRQVLQTLENIWPNSHIERKPFDGAENKF
jgi:hypothetical protein